MTDTAISIALVAATVLCCEATRRAVAPLLSRGYWINFVEIVSTFQLCACTHEVKLLGESGQIEQQIALTITYIIAVIHLSTFHGAVCNPYGAIECVYRRRISVKSAVVLIGCQFLAAVAAQSLAPAVWSLGLSDLHVKHQRFGFKCFDPINGTLIEAAAVELGCTFAVQALVLHIHKLDEKFHNHSIAAAITILVYAGGSISGAVFNPVLAFSIQFPCSGHTFLEYCFVYWLGPALGMVSCILLFEKILPFLSGKTNITLDVPVVQKKKVQ